jgi:DNA-binding LytR/AlgR family response regulator
MTTALLADDEPHMREVLRDQLQLLWPELEVIGEAPDGPSALLQIESLRPDIAFLDIRMPGMTGLQVARAVTVPARIVFVTAFDSHALEAFEAHAVDYVLKPIETARMATVVARLKKAVAAPAALSAHQLMDALAQLGLQPAAPAVAASPASGKSGNRLEWIQVAVGQQVHMVHVDDVRYFESDTKYTRVVTNDTQGLIRVSLKELLEQLDSLQYLQTHRSTLVNRRFIRAVHRRGESMEIELKGQSERLKVSLANHHLFRAM